MPRVANASRPMRQPTTRDNLVSSPLKWVSNEPLRLALTCIRIPLNDDKQEKQVRFQSRQALHDLQINSLRAAVVSPMRRVSGQGKPSGGGPQTPQQSMVVSDEVGADGDVMAAAAGNSMTPMKRVRMLCYTLLFLHQTNQCDSYPQ